MMSPPVSRLRPAIAALAILAAAAGPASAAPATGDRPAGSVSDWSHELNQNELPAWNPATAPVIAPRRWFPLVRSILHEAGRNGLWFSGPSALPFPPLPLGPKEPVGWRTRAAFSREFARTGLRWDVAYEVWAARKALQKRTRGRRRPHGRPDRLHAPPLAARPGLPARRRCGRSAGSSRRCATRRS